MKKKVTRKSVIVPQQFHPSQIGELSIFCVLIRENRLDDLFEFIVNNGGRVISAIPRVSMQNKSVEILIDGYPKDYYFVISMCQQEIVDTLMLDLCKTFEINKRGNGNAFVLDVFGYMGAKGPFVE